TFSGRPTRNARQRESVVLDRPKWTLPLNPVYVPRWEHPRVALPERGLLSRYAVTFKEGVFIHDGTTIRGLRLADGKPLWPVDDDPSQAERPGKIYPPFPTLPSTLPWTPVVGLPRFTTTVHEGRLYALLGPSVFTLPPGGHQASPTRLICLDLAQSEGRLEWFHTPEELFSGGWMVTGTPIAGGNRLYVPLVRTEPQIEVSVACLQADDGSKVWHRSIGQVLREPLRGRV
ncbi:unnamed protein product, partial [marine sediment metagenome]